MQLGQDHQCITISANKLRRKTKKKDILLKGALGIVLD